MSDFILRMCFIAIVLLVIFTTANANPKITSIYEQKHQTNVSWPKIIYVEPSKKNLNLIKQFNKVFYGENVINPDILFVHKIENYGFYKGLINPATKNDIENSDEKPIYRLLTKQSIPEVKDIRICMVNYKKIYQDILDEIKYVVQIFANKVDNVVKIVECPGEKGYKIAYDLENFYRIRKYYNKITMNKNYLHRLIWSLNMTAVKGKQEHRYLLEDDQLYRIWLNYNERKYDSSSLNKNLREMEKINTIYDVQRILKDRNLYITNPIEVEQPRVNIVDCKMNNCNPIRKYIIQITKPITSQSTIVSTVETTTSTTENTTESSTTENITENTTENTTESSTTENITENTIVINEESEDENDYYIDEQESEDETIHNKETKIINKKEKTRSPLDNENKKQETLNILKTDIGNYFIILIICLSILIIIIMLIILLKKKKAAKYRLGNNINLELGKEGYIAPLINMYNEKELKIKNLNQEENCLIENEEQRLNNIFNNKEMDIQRFNNEEIENQQFNNEGNNAHVEEPVMYTAIFDTKNNSFKQEKKNDIYNFMFINSLSKHINSLLYQLNNMEENIENVKLEDLKPENKYLLINNKYHALYDKKNNTIEFYKDEKISHLVEENKVLFININSYKFTSINKDYKILNDMLIVDKNNKFVAILFKKDYEKLINIKIKNNIEFYYLNQCVFELEK